MKLIKTIIAVFSVTGFTVIMGACALQDYLVPCYIDKRVAEYTESPLTEMIPYTTIADAKRLGRELNFQHVEKREELLTAVEKDSRLHGFLSDVLEGHLIEARELKNTIFGPGGAASVLAGLLGLGAGAVFVKRPGDLRPDEVEEV